MKRHYEITSILLFFALCLPSVLYADPSPKPTPLSSPASSLYEEESCFSPDENCGERLKKFIHSAAKSLDIAVYDINLESIRIEIIAQSKKIPVRLLVDHKQSSADKTSSVPELIKNGVIVKYGRQKGIMHNKFVLVDGTLLETGSFNFTDGADLGNSENQVYLSNRPLVEKFKARFEKLWFSGRPSESQ